MLATEHTALLDGAADTLPPLSLTSLHSGKHGIGADVEVVAMKDVNSAMERLRKGDVKFRFVIDVQGTLG